MARMPNRLPHAFGGFRISAIKLEPKTIHQFEQWLNLRLRPSRPPYRAI
jgi:hypothetical protein